MKRIIRVVFSPILSIFESGSEPFSYKPSYRVILICVGCLFSGLALVVFVMAQGEDPTYLVPVLIFGCAGFVSLLIGLVGTDRAVAKIWGSR